MKTLLLSTLILCMFTTGQSWAQDEESSSSALRFSEEGRGGKPSGIVPFIGAGGGYTAYDSELDVEGVPTTLKLLGSYYFDMPLILDVGYGFNNQQFSQDGALDDTITDSALELAARYGFGNRWQIGVVADHFFNQGGNYGAEQADAQFAGIQLLKEFNISQSWLARVGGRVQTLTNTDDRAVNMAMIDLQIGWNPGSRQPTTSSAMAEDSSQSDTSEMAATEYGPAGTGVAATDMEEGADSEAMMGAATDVPLDAIAQDKLITFPVGQAQVKEQDQNTLSQVAEVLNDNPELVERVEIRGHADVSGSTELNQRLSEQRASEVASALQESGLTNVEITTVGRGEADAQGTSPQDRRAELVFVGVQDEDSLRDALSSIE